MCSIYDCIFCNRRSFFTKQLISFSFCISDSDTIYFSYSARNYLVPNIFVRPAHYSEFSGVLEIFLPVKFSSTIPIFLPVRFNLFVYFVESIQIIHLILVLLFSYIFLSSLSFWLGWIWVNIFDIIFILEIESLQFQLAFCKNQKYLYYLFFIFV